MKISELKKEDFVKIGFKSAIEGKRFIKDSKLRGSRNITKNDFLINLEKLKKEHNKKLENEEKERLNKIKIEQDKKEKEEINNYIKKVKDYNKKVIGDTKFDVNKNGKKILTEVVNKINVDDKDHITILKIDTDNNTYHYVITDRIKSMLDDIYSDTHSIDEYDTDSETTIYKIIQNDTNIKSISVERSERKEIDKGGFLKYISNNKLKEIDLSRYGIYNDINQINYNNQCLIKALELSGVNKESIDNLKTLCRNNKIAKKELRKFAEKYDYCINLRFDNEKYPYVIYNKESKNKIYLGLLDEHYFVIDSETNITSYAIENYDKVKNLKNWNKIYGFDKKGNPKRANNRNVNSFLMMKELLKNYEDNLNNEDNQLLKRIKIDHDILDTTIYDKVDITNYDLNYNPKYSTLPIEYEDRKEKNTILVGFDFETTTEHKHVPYLVNCRIYDNYKLYNSRTFYGLDCGKQMLIYITVITEKLKNKYQESNLKTRIILMAHNLGYDFTFIKDYLTNIQNLTHRSSNSFVGGKIMFYYKKFVLTAELRDSNALFQSKLQKYSSIFGLEDNKEIMPYSIYTKKAVHNYYETSKNKTTLNKCEIDTDYINNTYSLKKALKALKNNKEREQFKENIEKWNLFEDDKKKKFKFIEYSARYCELDVKVMCEAMIKLREWIKNDLQMELFDHLTSASLADNYFLKQGCYKDCYELGGIPRYFISKCVEGARTMTRSNKKYCVKHIDGETKIFGSRRLNDFDAVSLYPSAMRRMKGFVKGIPKVIPDEYLNCESYKTMEYLNDKDAYYVEIEITKINKHYNFPLISRINKDGIRVYSNELSNIKEERIYYVDDIRLNDFIKYQQIEFNVRKGYYFNEGFNNKINEVIQDVFNKRVEYKDHKDKNKRPIQELYKLLMNSAYGKTLIKERDREYKFVKGEDKMKEYLIRNHYKIVECVKVSDNNIYKITEINPIVSHFNRCHIGSHILSMSKRIMNEVMTLAEELGINIFYQDTDSMHIEDHEVDRLAKEYKMKYGRELIGKQMGQFHCDFDPYEKDNVKYMGTAIESYFLGKKAYVDKIEYVLPDEIAYHYHIRMKGVPTDVIKKHADDHYNGDVMELYKDLYEGKTIEFNLLSCGIKFKKGKGMIYLTNNKFTRKVSF